MINTETFLESLHDVKDKCVLATVSSILANVDLRVYDRPASSSGKYHPYETRGEHGLARHSMYVVNAAIVLMDADKWYDKHPLNRDLVIAACALHDVFKYGADNDQEHTISDHPEIAYKLLMKISKEVGYFSDDKREDRLMRKYTKYIAKLIRSHHGKWGKHPCNTRDKQIVHSADMIASRLHKIEMRDNVPTRDELLDWAGYLTNAVESGLMPEVFTSAMLAFYDQGPGTNLKDCLDYGFNEWIK